MIGSYVGESLVNESIQYVPTDLKHTGVGSPVPSLVINRRNPYKTAITPRIGVHPLTLGVQSLCNAS